MPDTRGLQPRFDDVAHRLHGRHFHELAGSLRAQVKPILTRWREQSLLAIPRLDQFTVEQFEDSMAAQLHATADAMETDDPAQLRRLIEQAPLHGADRIAQEYPIDALLAEGSILRGSIVVKLQEHLGRALSDGEAAALHEVIDLAFKHTTLEFIRLRNLHRESEVTRRVAGIRRLADLGTLVAGVSHDAINLLLPARMAIDRLTKSPLPDEARPHLQLVEETFRQFQNIIVNLRWLTVDADHQRRENVSLDLREFAQKYRDFFGMMLPRGVSLEIRVPDDLPPVQITAAALSQILLNLIRNGQEAIIKHQQRGRMLLLAERVGERHVDLFVEDDGPGMAPEMRERCFEPFATTKTGEASGGLGLSVVHALVTGSGGTIDIHSPAIHLDPTRGAAVVLHLPAAKPATTRKTD